MPTIDHHIFRPSYGPALSLSRRNWTREQVSRRAKQAPVIITILSRNVSPLSKGAKYAHHIANFQTFLRPCLEFESPEPNQRASKRKGWAGTSHHKKSWAGMFLLYQWVQLDSLIFRLSYGPALSLSRRNQTREQVSGRPEQAPVIIRNLEQNSYSLSKGANYAHHIANCPPPPDF